MDFEKILSEWESQKNAKGKRKKNENERMSQFLDTYGPGERDVHAKDLGDEGEKNEKIAKRKALLLMKPERSLDLHGLRADEAIERVNAFLKECKEAGLRKVLIIHGKGLHSTEPPVLAKRIIAHVQKCREAGEYGVAPREWGGRGALWVVLR
jgi:DNA-nicking Smr family endonuclease